MDPDTVPEANPESKDLQDERRSRRIEAERIAERVRFIFRQAGDNLPARELEQRLMVYRLRRISE